MSETMPGQQATSYADVDVIVDGALAHQKTFTDHAALTSFIEQERDAAVADGLWTEVYILWHEHPMTDEECTCAQYATDHHPDFEWNARNQ